MTASSTDPADVLLDRVIDEFRSTEIPECPFDVPFRLSQPRTNRPSRTRWEILAAIAVVVLAAMGVALQQRPVDRRGASSVAGSEKTVVTEIADLAVAGLVHRSGISEFGPQNVPQAELSGAVAALRQQLDSLERQVNLLEVRDEATELLQAVRAVVADVR